MGGLQIQSRILVIMGAIALILFVVLHAIPLRAQEIRGSDIKLREYLLPVSGYVDSGSPVSLDPESNLVGMYSTASDISFPEGLIPCPSDYGCGDVSGNKPYFVRDDYAQYRVRIPQTGKYRVELTTKGFDPVTDNALALLTDEQIDALYSTTLDPTWNKSHLFKGAWGKTEKREAIRNHIFGIYQKNASGGWDLSEYIRVPAREYDNQQKGSIFIDLPSGEHDFLIRLENDLYIAGLHTLFPGTDFSLVTPTTILGRNVLLTGLEFVPTQRTDDVLGVRVYSNKENLDARTWYLENVINARQGVSEIEVDGYKGVRDGRTVYVHAANVTESGFYTNIYVLAYNINAAATTGQIFDLMLKNWKFNKNILELTAAQDTYSQEEIKDQIRRDTKRLADISALQRALENYKQRTGLYPALSSGTYVPDHTLSVWPSWQGNLGAQLGISLPQDPLNKMVDVKIPGDTIVAYDCSIQGCSDPRFSTQEACEAPRGFWNPGNAIVGEWDSTNQTCSISSYNGNETACLTPRGGCSDPRYETEAACTAALGAWSDSLNVLENGFFSCSISGFTTQGSCETNGGRWVSKCDIFCSLDDAGLPQTGCPANNQCLGDYCSQVPAGFNPQTGWDDTAQRFYDTTTHSSACPTYIAGALRLGATDCAFNGPYIYQYTSLDNGARYLLNYRLEYQSSLGGCAANECFYDINSNDAVDSGECIASGQCIPGLRNAVCQVGVVRNSCGDGFLQPECGEICDPSISDPTGSFCDNSYGAQDWHNESNISGGCSNACDLVDYTGGGVPPSYSKDPLILSCGGYCGDQVVQFEYGESCDVGAAPSVLKLPNQGGSGGSSVDSQYFCTGSAGTDGGFVFNTNPGFETDVFWTGATGQAGGWDGKLWTGGTLSSPFTSPELSRDELAQAGTWVFSQYKHYAHSWSCSGNGKSCDINLACGTPSANGSACADQRAQDYCATSGWGSCTWNHDIDGYADTSVSDKHWISYDLLLTQPAAIQEEYYKGAGDPVGLSLINNPLVIEQTQDDAHSGSSSIRVTDTGPKSTSLWKVFDGIRPGAQYSVSAFVKADSVHDWNLASERDSKQVFTHLIFFDDAYTPLGVSTNKDVNGADGLRMQDLSATSWQEIRISGTAPVGVTKAVVIIRTGYLERGAAFFVDDMTLGVIGNCQTTQGWCGDGVIQSQFGEVCDPGSYLPPKAEETRNIIKNPSFEQVFAPWKKSSSVGIRIVSFEAFGGRYGLEYEFHDPYTQRSSISQTLTIYKNKNYIATLRAKPAIGAINAVYLQYRELGNTSSWQEVQLQQAGQQGDGWTTYSARFTPTTDVGEVHFVFELAESVPDAKALVYVDGIELLPDDHNPGAFLPPQYQCGTNAAGQICQFKGGYCGDGKIDFGFGEACDDRVGYSCTSNAQCGSAGRCENNICVSDQCDLLCRGTFCGDGVVSRPNSQGIQEVCDPLNDPTCFYDCKGMGGSCVGNPAVCAETLTCAVREFGDTDPVCLGTRGSNGCRSNNDCILGYYCDATTTQCKPEIPTYLQFHGEQSTQISLPPGFVYDLTTGVCPNLVSINAGGTTYQLDTCTNIYWNGSDNISKPGWTWQDALVNGCFGVHRLPTVDELYSLVKQTSIQTTGSEPYVDKAALNLCCTSCGYDDSDPDLCIESATDSNYLYWTSTCVEGSDPANCERALAVNFKYGSVEAYPVDTQLKTHCLKETVCGNGVIEEGETCEFYTQLIDDLDPTKTCTRTDLSQCAAGQVCSANNRCADRNLFEQPLTTQCSDLGFDAGKLHCDVQSCTLRTDNCVYSSVVDKTCTEVCSDNAQICQSVGSNVDQDYFTTSLPQVFSIADDGVRYGIDEAGLCTRDSGTSCNYRFVDQEGNCIVNEATGEVAPYTSEYSYCNCSNN